ncbi:hypothetical protein J2S19_001919 [Metabacillus malikii]|uniref:DUF5658 domain-containing protein n=2 Tax=Metabacillus malikii TaxID=1504265 RepID=A0ABT9ZEJ9_9BACI|nr:hypothetical protein [Metabacillus malikii]
MLFAYYLSIQWGSVLLFLFIEWAMVDFFELGTFKKANTFFQKVTNFFMYGLIGSGYLLYIKFKNNSWIIRKIYMLIALVLHGILAIIIYFVITFPLELILGSF